MMFASLNYSLSVSLSLIFGDCFLQVIFLPFAISSRSVILSLIHICSWSRPVWSSELPFRMQLWCIFLIWSLIFMLSLSLTHSLSPLSLLIDCIFINNLKIVVLTASINFMPFLLHSLSLFCSLYPALILRIAQCDTSRSFLSPLQTSIFVNLSKYVWGALV